MSATTELWFLIRDLRPLVWHASRVATHQPPDGAVLRLYTQGPLVFMTAGGQPDLLLDPANQHSVWRAYAAGRAQPGPGEPAAAEVRLLGRLALCGPDHLDDALIRAHGSRRWLVVTRAGGGLRWRVAARPGAPAPTGWVEGDMRVLGLDAYQGEYAEHDTWRGWCLARFPAATARVIATDVNALPRNALRRGLTRLRLVNQPTGRDGTPDRGAMLTVGPDTDGCYRIGAGRWQWVTLDVLEPDQRVPDPFDGPIPHAVDPAGMPAIGQLAHQGDTLMWRSGGAVYLRDYSGGHTWPDCPATRLTHRGDADRTTRAAEYLLRAADVDAHRQAPRRRRH